VARRLALIRALLLAVLAAGPVLATAAAAHPFITRNLRVVHFSNGADGRLIAYMRLTLPLLVGGDVPAPAATGPVTAAPYTVARRESGMAFWYADIAAITRDPDGLGRLLISGTTLAADGVAVPGTLLGVAVHPRGHVPPFDDVAEARAAVAPTPWPPDVTEIDSGYVLVDAAVAYPVPPGTHRFTLSSTLSPGPLGEPGTVNLLVDHRGGGATYYRIGGALTDPVVVAPGPLEGMGTFVTGGIGHILEGVDHLLFVICLVLGASGIGALASRITGFTVGHSITLAVGFFGLAPKPAWFEPGIEAAIAVSIVLAGLSTLLGRGGRMLILVTVGIGLIHGFGFSYSLRDLLSADGPNVVPGLAGFNIGVEIGQLMVGLSVYALFQWLRRFEVTERRARLCVVVAAMVVASVWIVDRVPAVWVAATTGVGTG
jgi:hypothetical protein